MASPFANIESASMIIEDSSLVSNIEWNRVRGTDLNCKGNIILTFKANGERYEYVDVPVTVLEEMLKSESIGSYFHANIKDNYETYKEL